VILLFLRRGGQDPQWETGLFEKRDFEGADAILTQTTHEERSFPLRGADSVSAIAWGRGRDALRE